MKNHLKMIYVNKSMGREKKGNLTQISYETIIHEQISNFKVISFNNVPN